MSEGNKPKNDPSDIASKNAMIENEQLKIENAQLKVQLDIAKKALIKDHDTIESQERARMIPFIKANTIKTNAEIDAMDAAAMFELIDNLRILKRPIAGVKPAADEGEEFNAKLTVPNKFRFGPKGGSK